VSVSVTLQREGKVWPVVGDVDLRCAVATLPHSDMLVSPNVFREPNNPFCTIFYGGTRGAQLGDSHALLQSHVVRGSLTAAVETVMQTPTLSAATVTSSVADASGVDDEALAWEIDRRLLLEDEELEGSDELDLLNDRALEAVDSVLPSREDISACVCTSFERRDEMIDLLFEQRKLFTEIDATGCTIEGSELRIPVPEDAVPYNIGKHRFVHPTMREEIWKLLSACEAAGTIERVRPDSKRLRWGHPMVSVRKANGKIRYCIDCSQGLNKWVQLQPYKMPDMQHIFNRTRGKKFFSTIDLISGFHQIRVHPDSQQYLTFHTEWGSYQYLRMPFGYLNAPSFFQMIMETALAAEIEAGICDVWIDDILIMSDNAEDHIKHVQRVIKALDRAGFRMQLSKSTFCKREITYLGYVINGGERRQNPRKLDALRQLPVPATKKLLIQFLALCGYFSSFVPSFAELAEGLRALVRPDVILKRDWKDINTIQFEKLRDAVVNALPLTIPRFDRPFMLRTDASDIGVGGMLLQYDDDGAEQILQFLSHKLTKAERKWNVTERECFAIVYCVKHLSEYLRPARFVLETDHLNLTYIRNSMNARVRRWYLYLLQYQFDIRHIPGDTNVVADALSRLHPFDGTPEQVLVAAVMADLCDSGLWPNVPGVGLCDDTTTMVASAGAGALDDAESDDDATSTPTSQGIHSALLGEIAAAQVAASAMQINEWTKDDQQYSQLKIGGISVWMKAGSIVVPSGNEHDDLWSRILRIIHDDVLHPGIKQTMNRLQTLRVWRAGMRKSVERYVKSCVVCQRDKGQHRPTHTGEMAYVLSHRPWSRIQIDYMTGLPASTTGNTCILVCIDTFTRYIEMQPYKKATGANTIDFLEKFIRNHTIPEHIQSDGGSHFNKKTMPAWFEKYNIQHHFTSVGHAQSNGKVEHMNERIVTKIRAVIGYKYKTWDEVLPQVASTLNSEFNRSIGMSPFEALTGFPPRSEAAAALGLPSKKVSTMAEYQQLLAAVREHVNMAQEVAVSVSKREYDKTTHPLKLKEDDWVWFVKAPRHKLEIIRGGPFQVKKILEGNVLRVRSALGEDREDHASCFELADVSRLDTLERFRRSCQAGHAVVEKILDHNYEVDGDDTTLQFLVKWDGYDDSLNQWRAYEDIKSLVRLQDYMREVGLVIPESRVTVVRKRTNNRRR
jgi:transposase InsO family protein